MLQPCRKGADVRLHRDAHWSSAGSEENLKKSIMHESTGAAKGTGAAYGGEGRAWGRPIWGPSARWQHLEPYGTHAHCQCQTPRSLWAAFPAFHSSCNSRAPAQQAQGQRSCVRSSWEGQCTMPSSSRSQREMAEPWGSHRAVELLSHLPTASAASGGLSHQQC